MGADSFSIGQSIVTDSGDRVEITNTSDPTCLTGIGPNGEKITVRRSEVSNPIFNTYQEKLAKLESKYERTQSEYRETCANSEKYADIRDFHCGKKNGILRDAGTVSWSNLEGENKSEFDNHYDLYWGARFNLTASYNQEYSLTRASGEILQDIAKCKRTFGV